MECIGVQYCDVGGTRKKIRVYTDDYDRGVYFPQKGVSVAIRFVEMVRVPTPHDTACCSLWKIIKRSGE
jgi:hypothetical protein